jgi:hypothetical protein
MTSGDDWSDERQLKRDDVDYLKLDRDDVMRFFFTTFLIESGDKLRVCRSNHVYRRAVRTKQPRLWRRGLAGRIAGEFGPSSRR